MQSVSVLRKKRVIFFICPLVMLIFLLAPRLAARAESRHFAAAQVAAGVEFVSADQLFTLKVPAGAYQQPMDIYLFNKSADNLKDLNAISEIYSYYIYSVEVSDQSEFSVTIGYNGEQTEGKTVYYYDAPKNLWQMASSRSFLNSLTFSLSGKKNQLVVAGRNLAQSSLTQQSFGQVSLAYYFDANAAASELEFKKVCPLYLKSFFRDSNGNDREEVKKLQSFLSGYEGYKDLPATGYYGVLTRGAVKQFQEKYATDILAPWDLTEGTGWVLQTTLDKVNQLYCQYNPAKVNYELNIPYELSEKNAKMAYYFDESLEPEGQWLPLESYDDSKSGQVTAIIDKPAGQIALFILPDQWVGEASWYAWQDGLFAASRDFPQGTRLRVTNQSAGENRGKAVIVTVNDYGPQLWTGRIIDLDKEAYESIGNLKGGVMPVKLEVYKE